MVTGTVFTHHFNLKAQNMSFEIGYPTSMQMKHWLLWGKSTLNIYGYTHMNTYMYIYMIINSCVFVLVSLLIAPTCDLFRHWAVLINRLNNWDRVTNICVSKLTIIDGTWPAPSHYLNRCWNIVNWNPNDKILWNLLWNGGNSVSPSITS